ncbi:TMEM175 family protein [Georgenia thermotolerans]|uniref:TMEM175 family protein n=1 Tax=Georgenia thermotolerans TaxID=527326 RepID=UPI001B8C1AB8|nr:TMEM175 family protein [Georgenia thermotolerans]
MESTAKGAGARAAGRRLPTGRLEAFSDGVLATAISLLVLEIEVPPAARHRPRRAA